MARSMWKGAIQFGLVTIPVKMYLATESKGVSFHMLHATDHSRIQMKIYCPADDALIERSETVKGYEIAPDQYVVITDEDLANLPLKTVRSIEIAQFVPVESDGESSRFVKGQYYLEPEQVGRKAYSLLRDVLARKNLRAICKIVIRDREQLAALDPFGDAIMVSTLYWPDEVRSVSELSIPDEEAAPKPAELQMAEQLVGMMTGEFDPKAYRDEYRDALMAMIEAKTAGETVTAPEPAPATKLTDLVAALEASVAQARAARAGGAPEKAAAASKKAKAPVGVPVMAEQTPEEALPVRKRKTA